MDEEIRVDKTMWLTVYEGYNEKVSGCRELGVTKRSSDKVKGTDGAFGTHDIQAMRNEPEEKWEESYWSYECGGGFGRNPNLLDKRSLDILDWEKGHFTLSCRFRNVENGVVWVFTGVYGLSPKWMNWDEFGVIRGLVDLLYRREISPGMGATITKLGQDWTDFLCHVAG
ncbi:hypothetical protein CK203_032408 [Vitis vinifera]|uniref:Uncharacterized protein n=1 Tax=Vitis vinifera TaxID=29760 RepID=A0A438IJZ0_VITVI|nr:hypothetical protein CK203_032408 [Vitis vinifera]